ncbi:MAG: Rab family GTPase [Candidatus Heimdallarchaeota archaeon]
MPIKRASNITLNPDAANELKIVLVGDSKVGKTTLLETLKGDGMIERGYSVSLQLESREIAKNSSSPKVGRIFDLRSQRFFPFLHSIYYHGAKGAIIVFDVTNRLSFESVIKWRDIIWGHVGKIPLLLVGNKSDLKNDPELHISINEGKALAKELSALQEIPVPYLEVSAVYHIIAFCDERIKPIETEDIYPTYEEFRKPFYIWLIEIIKKGGETKL